MNEIITAAPTKRTRCPVSLHSMVYSIAKHIHDTNAPLPYESALQQFNLGRYLTTKIIAINDAIGRGWLDCDAGNLALGRLAKRWFHVATDQDAADMTMPCLPPYRASIFGRPLSKQYIPSAIARRDDAGPAHNVFLMTTNTVAEPKVRGVVLA